VGERHVFFKLRDGIDADDDAADRVRKRVLDSFPHAERAGTGGNVGARAALGEKLVDVGHRADIVKLPDIDVIGLEQTERFLDHAHRTIPGAFLGFSGEEGFLPARLQTMPM